jgi:hypothetical protein
MGTEGGITGASLGGDEHPTKPINSNTPNARGDLGNNVKGVKPGRKQLCAPAVTVNPL